MKKLMITLLLAMAAYAGQAQVMFYVKNRPQVPEYLRPGTSPGNNYVWISEEWVYNNATGEYQWDGNRWAESPDAAARYYSGRWKRDKKEGYAWVSGYWR
jgi:hypothetical protein